MISTPPAADAGKSRYREPLAVLKDMAARMVWSTDLAFRDRVASAIASLEAELAAKPTAPANVGELVARLREWNGASASILTDDDTRDWFHQAHEAADALVSLTERAELAEAERYAAQRALSHEIDIKGALVTAKKTAERERDEARNRVAGSRGLSVIANYWMERAKAADREHDETIAEKRRLEGENDDLRNSLHESELTYQHLLDANKEHMRELDEARAARDKLWANLDYARRIIDALLHDEPEPIGKVAGDFLKATAALGDPPVKATQEKDDG